MYQMVVTRKQKVAERLCSPPCTVACSGSLSDTGMVLVVQPPFVTVMVSAGCCGQGCCCLCFRMLVDWTCLPLCGWSFCLVPGHMGF